MVMVTGSSGYDWYLGQVGVVAVCGQWKVDILLPPNEVSYSFCLCTFWHLLPESVVLENVCI